MRKNMWSFKKNHFRLHFSCSSSDCDSTSLPADPSGDPSDQVVPGGGQVTSSKHSNLTIDDHDDYVLYPDCNRHAE